VAMRLPSAASILFKAAGNIFRKLSNLVGELKIVSSYWCQTSIVLIMNEKQPLVYGKK